MPSSAAEVALRQDPDAWTKTLAYRTRAELPFDPADVPASQPVMLDTTVYVDALGPRELPSAIATLLRRNHIVHAAVACAELAITFGHLDPAHPSTPRNRTALGQALRRVPMEDARAPSPQAWVEAAVLAGILARVQGHAKGARRDLLLDALLLLTAVETSCVLISRNIRPMDLLTRLRPDAGLLLYDLA